MCTAIKDGNFFGRTLDLEGSYGELVAISGRKFPFQFKYIGKCADHYAMIGTAYISRGVPLYYDAINEHGLCAAALRFPALSQYHTPSTSGTNLASFEIIPWVLCNFKGVDDAKQALKSATITRDDFSHELPSSPLHWIIADRECAIVVESVSEGLRIHDATNEILTNAPDYPTQCENLSKLKDLKNSFSHIGKKSIDLPGDSSSTSRFIRAVYAKTHVTPAETNECPISRFFRVMDAVTQPKGFAVNDQNLPVQTVYTSCIDMTFPAYYFTTYACRQIHGVRLYDFDLDSDTLVTRPMPNEEKISYID